MITRLVLICVLIICCRQGEVSAQSQNSRDSSLAAIQALLLKSEAQRLRDSIRSAVLTEELQIAKRTSTALALKQELETIRLNDSIRLSQQAASVDSLRKITAGAPVLLLSDTLFRFYTPMGPFTAHERALNASDHILQLCKLVVFYPDSIQTNTLNSFVNLTYGKQTLLSLHETDAIWADTPLTSLAEEYRARIRSKVIEYRQTFNIRNNIIRTGQALLILFAAYLIWLGIRRLEAFLRRTLSDNRPLLEDGVKFRNYQALTDQQVRKYLLKGFGILKIVALITLVYVTMFLLFNTFPFTQSWTETLSQWIWDPLSNILSATYHYLPKFFTIVVLILIARYVAKILRYFSLEIERGILEIKGFHREWARPTYIIIRFMWYAFIFVLVFPYLPGSDSTAFKGVSVFLGVLFSIGSSSAISNTIAGFIITYMRPFRTGDWIKVSDITGQVMEKTFLVTRIRTINNEDVTVPNSSILAGHTINYSSAAGEMGLIISAKAGFIYDLDTNFVHQVLKEAALATTDIDTSKEPFVFHTALNDFYALYQVNAYTRKPERMFFIQSELYQNIQKACARAGITMMIPQPVDIQSGKS